MDQSRHMPSTPYRRPLPGPGGLLYTAMRLTFARAAKSSNQNCCEMIGLRRLLKALHRLWKCRQLRCRAVLVALRMFLIGQQHARKQSKS